MTTVALDEIAAFAITPEGDDAAVVTVERYYVARGAAVEAGDPVCMLRSERYVYDIPVERGGIVTDLLAMPGDHALVGAPLIRIAPAATAAVENRHAIHHTTLRATPLARKIAEAHDRDLQSISGTGPGGRIGGADVHAALAAIAPVGTGVPAANGAPPWKPAPAAVASGATLVVEAIHPATETSAPLSGRTPGIACEDGPEPTTARLSDVPRALTAIEVDLEQVAALQAPARHELSEGDFELVSLALVARAAAAALIEHRWINSTWSDEGIILHSRMDVGIATVLNGAPAMLVVPRAAEHSVRGLLRAIDDAGCRIHEGTVLRDELRHATFVITRSNGLSTRWTMQAIGGSQAALLGVGAAERRLVVVEAPTGTGVAVRTRTILTLWYDARHVSQAQADAFLGDIRQRIEHGMEVW